MYPPATAPAPALSHLYIVVSYLLANRLVQAVNVNLVRKRRRLCEMAFMGGGGGGIDFMHGRSLTTKDPRMRAMPRRSTSGFHRAGIRHRVHQA